MKETEVKILDINEVEIETKLIFLGAQKIYDGEMTAVFFENGFGNLRLRKIGDKAFLTFKKKVIAKNVKIADEYESEVDYENTKIIFEKLGYKIKMTSHKHRISYRLKNVQFEIELCVCSTLPD